MHTARHCTRSQLNPVCRVVFLHVITHNVEAQKFYQRRGFTCRRRLYGFYTLPTHLAPVAGKARTQFVAPGILLCVPDRRLQPACNNSMRGIQPASARPDPQNLYDAFLYVQYINGGSAPWSPLAVLSAALSTLRAVLDVAVTVAAKPAALLFKTLAARDQETVPADDPGIVLHVVQQRPRARLSVGSAAIEAMMDDT